MAKVSTTLFLDIVMGNAVLHQVESVWLDGPCRSCRCESGPRGASARCSVTECGAVVSTAQFVLEPRPVPFQCCPVPLYVACIDQDNIYKVQHVFASITLLWIWLKLSILLSMYFSFLMFYLYLFFSAHMYKYIMYRKMTFTNRTLTTN